MRKIPKGIFNVREAAACGLPRWRLSQMVDSGELNRVARGVYVRSGVEESAFPEIAILTACGTEYVVALESALRFWNFTSATPHALWIALKRGARRPRVDFPLEIVRVDQQVFAAEAVWQDFGGVRARVYSAAKTVADAFKFRSKVGLDLAIRALKEGFQRKLYTVDELCRCATVDRVSRVMMPYIEGCVG